MPDLSYKLIAQIRLTGPLSVADFMRAALYDPEHGYYATKSPIGSESAGDFITAPEISQMFGELIGLWAVQAWADLGAPDTFTLAELGPGRGVMMADALRASRVAPPFRKAARVRLVEVNPNLRAAQAERLKDAPDLSWADSLEALPPGSCVILGNEFLDCLPIRQFVRAKDGWRERLVGADGDALIFGLSPPVALDGPAHLKAAPEGALFEIAPGLEAIVDEIARRLRAAPGRALFVDYGAPEPGFGDTLQAVRRHKKVDPLAAPGECDLTAHVDFGALADLARARGLDVAGPVAQGQFLRALGIETRAGVLVAAHPHRTEEIGVAMRRLISKDAMGDLFQAICLSSPGLPPVAGF